MTPAAIFLRPKNYLKRMALTLFIFFGGHLFVLNATDTLPISVIVMTGLAVAVHSTNFILRDEEYDALCLDCDLTNKDILARSTMLIYDSLLLSGLLFGAGVLKSWTQYLYLGAGIFVVAPLWATWKARNTYRPGATQPRFAPNHILPPVFLAILVAYLSVTEAFVTPTGAQPFGIMVLLSTIAVGLRKQSTFRGFADKLRYGAIAGTVILLLWNFL